MRLRAHNNKGASMSGASDTASGTEVMKQVRKILFPLVSLAGAWWATWPYFYDAALATDLTAIWGVYPWLMAHPLRLAAFLPFFVWAWIVFLRGFSRGPY